MSQRVASGSVLGFRPFFTPSLPQFTSLTWTPTSTMASTTATTTQHLAPVLTPIRGLPVPAVQSVLLPVLFGGLMLAAIGVGLFQWAHQRQKEKERQSGIRAARLRRASSPFAPIAMANVNPDLEAGTINRDARELSDSFPSSLCTADPIVPHAQESLEPTKSSEAEGRLSRANSTRSFNLPRKPPPPYQPYA